MSGPTAALKREIPRVPGRIPEAYRVAIRECGRGRAPWPLLLLGTTGSGKTCAALSVSDFVLGTRVFFSEEDFQNALSATMSGQMMEERPGFRTDRVLTVKDIWDHWADATIAILDDFGQRRDTKGSGDLLYNAINKREHKPLIITSNLKWTEIAARYDDRIVSRLECGTMADGFSLADMR